MKQSDSASTLSQFTRDGARPENGKLVKELKESKSGRRFEVVIIEEGMGNFGDRFYYSGEVLKKCAPLFEGKKIYANHPSNSEEQDRPERDVRDILGYFENVRAKESEGRVQMLADVVIPQGSSFEWARELMIEALEFKKKHNNKELIGISINASGEAEEKQIKDLLSDNAVPQASKRKLNEALEQGIETIRYTTEITNAVSADLVTEAGAGGKINKMLEGKKTMIPGEQNDGEKKDAAADQHADAPQDKALVADMLKKHLGDDAKGMDETAMEGLHEAYEMAKEMGHEGEEAAKMACAYQKMSAAKQKKQAAVEAEEKAKVDEAAKKEAEEKKENDDKEESKEKKESEVAKLTGRVAFLEGELRKEKIEKYVEKKLQESKLPRAVTDQIRKIVGDVKALKSEKDFDAKLDLFLEGYKMKAESESFIFTTEKIDAITSTEAEVSFEECLQ